MKQNILYTKRISEHKALQINALYSSNDISQGLEVSPSMFNANTDLQDISLTKNYFRFKTTMLGSNGKNKYKLSLGSNFIREPLKTILLSLNDDTSLVKALNQINYATNEAYVSAENLFIFNKISIKPGFRLSYLNQKLNNKVSFNSQSLSQIVLELAFRLSYGINRNSFIQTDFSFNSQPHSVDRFFNNEVLISQRTVLNNQPDLRLQRNQMFDISYMMNDLFDQLQLDIGMGYLKQKGNYFANSQINESTVTTNYFFLLKNTETTDFHFNITKYIPFLKSTLKMKTFYSIHHYKNIINNSSLRNNKSNYFTNELLVKTAFKNNLNFENELIFRHNKTTSTLTVENSFLQNKLNVIYKPSSKLLAIFSFDHFTTNLKTKASSISLFDLTFSYFLKKNLELKCLGSNLTNQKDFTVFQNNDTSSNEYNTGLLPRYVMLGFNWNF